MQNSIPFVYWENLLEFKNTKLLALIGSRILSIPASSAGVERSFSTQGHLHSKVRNRLNECKIDKLMRIKWALQEESKSTSDIHNLTSSQSDSQVSVIDVQTEETESEDIDIDEIIELDECYTESELLDLVGLS